jgi:hypothetical protein
MTAAELLQGLKARGATVAANGDRLKLAAPPGVLSARVLDFAAQHKTELLALLQSDPLTPGAVPPADGLARRDDVEVVDLLDQATKEKEGAQVGNCNAGKTTVYNVNGCFSNERPVGNSEAAALRRLRKDAPLVTAAELLAAHRTIKPTLRKDLSVIDLHELALTLAHAHKRENRLRSDVYRPAREFYPRDVYQPEKAKESY